MQLMDRATGEAVLLALPLLESQSARLSARSNLNSSDRLQQLKFSGQLLQCSFSTSAFLHL